jgi:hypothetical protein
MGRDIRDVWLPAYGLPARTGYREVEIRSHLPGVPSERGVLCQCSSCDGEAWAVWQIDGDPGVHLQCVSCGAVYCLGHECVVWSPTDQEPSAAGDAPPDPPAGEAPPEAETGGASCLIV